MEHALFVARVSVPHQTWASHKVWPSFGANEQLLNQQISGPVYHIQAANKARAWSWG